MIDLVRQTHVKIRVMRGLKTLTGTTRRPCTQARPRALKRYRQREGNVQKRHASTLWVAYRKDKHYVLAGTLLQSVLTEHNEDSPNTEGVASMGEQ